MIGKGKPLEAFEQRNDINSLTFLYYLSGFWVENKLWENKGSKETGELLFP